jgi:hypothetical protein
MLIKQAKSVSTCRAATAPHLTSREADSVGGQMVKNMYPGRTKKFERISRISMGYVQSVEYIAFITV